MVKRIMNAAKKEPSGYRRDCPAGTSQLLLKGMPLKREKDILLPINRNKRMPRPCRALAGACW
jgi:hypothetical protein